MGVSLSREALRGFLSCANSGGVAGFLRTDFYYSTDCRTPRQGLSPQLGQLRALLKQTAGPTMCHQMLGLLKIPITP